MYLIPRLLAGTAVLMLVQGGVLSERQAVEGGCREEGALHSALRAGNLTRLRTILDQTKAKGLYEANCRGLTPMHLAVLADSPDLVAVLYEHGYQLDRKFALGRTVLHFAVLAGKREAARALLDFGASADALDDTGNPPLALALRRDDPDIVHLLVRSNATLKRVTSSGDNYVQLAVRLKAGSALSSLLQLGLSPERTSSPGTTVPPVRLAVLGDDPVSLRLLTGAGASLNIKSIVGGRNLLHEAVILGHRAAVSWLLREGGLLPDAVDSSGRSALHMAASRGLADIARELLASRADINLQDGAGHSPLYYAKLGRHTGLADLLIARGAKEF